MQGVLFRVCVCWGCWREYAVSFRSEVPGMVPLTSRAAAKGGERGDSCYGHIGIF